MENLTLLESYQYDDVNNTFKWPPYGALFHSSETGGRIIIVYYWDKVKCILFAHFKKH